ncbi:MAG: translocation/assembly module TamB domain-containing protein, partial [Sedimenticola sp.]|nr:translocation/assembly module TamB domain-containing protein [Sedimenticola sp.]
MKRLFTSLALLIVLSLAGGAWLLGTTGGNQRLLQWTIGDQLEIRSFQGSLFEGLTLEDITYKDAELRLTIQSLKLAWQPAALFSGLLHIESLTASGIHYTNTAQTPSTDTASPPASLPVALQLDHAVFSDIQITTGTESHAITRMALQAKTTDNGIIFPDLQLSYSDYIASATGQLDWAEAYPFQFTIKWQGPLPELGQTTGEGVIKGNINALAIDHTTITPFKFTTRGKLTLTGAVPSLNLQGDWQQLRWPLQAAQVTSERGRYQLNGPLSKPRLQGEAALLFPGTDTPSVIATIETQLSAEGLDDLSVQLQEQGNSKDPAMTLNGTGAIQLGDNGPELAIKGDWRAARWPLLSPPLTVSPKGQFSLQGPLQQMALSSTATLLFPQKQAPDMEARLEGILSPSALNKLNLETDLLGGHSRITGEVSWAPALRWTLSLDGRSLNPAQQWPEWPGNLALDALVKGGENRQGLWLDADLKSLSGTLQQQPISASGQGQYDAAGLRLQNLKLNSGPNRLSADGQAGDTLNLNYQLDAPDLSAFWPALQGAITAGGSLTGTLTSPEISSTLKASDLAYKGDGIAQVEGALTWKQERASVQLDSKGLRIGEWRGRALSLTVTGRPDNHQAKLSLDSQALTLETRLKGGWLTQQWQGELSELTLTEPQLGRWTSPLPAHLKAGTEQITLTKTCLIQNSARLCAKGDWTPAKSRFDGELAALPLTRLLHWLPPEVSVEGAIDGRFQMEGPLTSLKGEANLILEQGALLLEATEEQPVRLALQDGLLALQMAPDKNKIQLRLKAGDGELALQANTGPFNTERPIALSGHLDAQLPDLKPIGLLLPGLSDLRGKLKAEATLGGYLQQPEIQGFMTLTEGSTNLPQLGLELKEITLSAKNQGTERLLLEGAMNSGGGLLKLEGDLLLNAEQRWPLTLKLKGEQVQVVRLPEAVAYASPELAITLKKNQLALRGTLTVPRASIQLKELPKSA